MEGKFKEGEQIGGYRIVRTLGKGGMGCVYEVEHEKLGVRYALKTFTLDHGAVDLLRRRFLVEGKILARLRHPNLVRVYDLDYDAVTGTPYFVMDLVLNRKGEPETMDDIRPGHADEATLLKWFGQVASALDHIHERGIVHRDVKPSNLLIDEFGSVVLTDFGISRYVDDELKKKLEVEPQNVIDAKKAATTQFILGTRAYMAPEVKVCASATAAADAYSLGLVFFWLIAGVWYTGKKEQVAILGNFERDWQTALPWLLNPKVALRPTRLRDVAELLSEGPEKEWRGRKSGIRLASAKVFLQKVSGLMRPAKEDKKGTIVPMETLTGVRDREANCPFCKRKMGVPADAQDGQHIRCPYCGSRTEYDQINNLLLPLSPADETPDRMGHSQRAKDTCGHLQRIPSVSEIVRLETARGQKNPFRPETPEEKPRTNHAKPRRRSGGRLRFHAISLRPLNRLFVHMILAVAVIALTFVV